MDKREVAKEKHAALATVEIEKKRYVEQLVLAETIDRKAES